MRTVAISALAFAMLGCTPPPPDQRCEVIGHLFEPQHVERRSIPEERFETYLDFEGDLVTGHHTVWVEKDIVVPDKWSVCVRYNQVDETTSTRWVDVSKEAYEHTKTYQYAQIVDGRICVE